MFNKTPTALPVLKIFKNSEFVAASKSCTIAVRFNKLNQKFRYRKSHKHDLFDENIARGEEGYTKIRVYKNSFTIN